MTYAPREALNVGKFHVLPDHFIHPYWTTFGVEDAWSDRDYRIRLNGKSLRNVRHIFCCVDAVFAWPNWRNGEGRVRRDEQNC